MLSTSSPYQQVRLSRNLSEASRVSRERHQVHPARPHEEQNHHHDEDADLALLLQTEEIAWAAAGGEGIAEVPALAHQRHPERMDTVHCAACTDPFPAQSTVHLPCNHYYCYACLRYMFEQAITDESAFPPRCCEEITLVAAAPAISAHLRDTFRAKTVEFTTANRTYCRKPRCATFIPPGTIVNDIARCPFCDRQTCAICKARTHRGTCPQDPATQQLIEVARREGWQRCYNCGHLVEHNRGCNHMQCRCRAEFCMLCGLRWHTCRCPLFSEANIIYQDEEPAQPPAQVQLPPQFNLARNLVAPPLRDLPEVRLHDLEEQLLQLNRGGEVPAPNRPARIHVLRGAEQVQQAEQREVLNHQRRNAPLEAELRRAAEQERQEAQRAQELHEAQRLQREDEILQDLVAQLRAREAEDAQRLQRYQDAQQRLFQQATASLNAARGQRARGAPPQGRRNVIVDADEEEPRPHAPRAAPHNHHNNDEACKHRRFRPAGRSGHCANSNCPFSRQLKLHACQRCELEFCYRCKLLDYSDECSHRKLTDPSIFGICDSCHQHRRLEGACQNVECGQAFCRRCRRDRL